METAENQNITSSRDQVIDRMRGYFPERNYVGQDGQDAPDDLAASVIEVLDSNKSKMDEYDEHNRQLVELFKTNPKAARFLNTWVRTKNPAIALRAIYGAETYEALQTEEGKELLAKLEADEAKQKADDEAAMKTKEENFNKSLDDFDAWAAEKGLSDDEKVKIFDEAYEIVRAAAQEGVYPTSLFEASYKASRYDADVANARHEGEVAGRNARIQESARKREAAANIPPALSGTSTRVPETAPTREKKWSDYLK